MIRRPPTLDWPPKPEARKDSVSLWRYLALFRRDILSAQPKRLYGAWMAEFRTPFFRSYLLNQPELIKKVLKTQPMDFPKSDRIGVGLRPLLGNSVFFDQWRRVAASTTDHRPGLSKHRDKTGLSSEGGGRSAGRCASTSTRENKNASRNRG